MSLFRVSGALVLMTALALGCNDDDTTSTPATGGGGGTGNTGNTGGTGGLILAGGSGGGSEGGSGGSTSGPGKITIEAELPSSEGKLLIASALTEGGSKLGGVCATFAGEPGAASAVVGKLGATICEVGEEIVFDPGLYRISAGLYVTGEPAPELCAGQDVEVAGDKTVTLSFFECL